MYLPEYLSAALGDTHKPSANSCWKPPRDTTTTIPSITTILVNVPYRNNYTGFPFYSHPTLPKYHNFSPSSLWGPTRCDRSDPCVLPVGLTNLDTPGPSCPRMPPHPLNRLVRHSPYWTFYPLQYNSCSHPILSYWHTFAEECMSRYNLTSGKILGGLPELKLYRCRTLCARINISTNWKYTNCVHLEYSDHACGVYTDRACGIHTDCTFCKINE